MRHSPTRRVASRHVVDRRRFVAGAIALPVACGLRLPGGGAFAAGTDLIRVGLVGCGGRGAGAAVHAIASPGVVIAAVGDMFADHLETTATLLESAGGPSFACPPDRRFVGRDAWRRVVESDVDLVILATPPAFRPHQAAAAVRAGRHVWCEKPAAVDAAGARIVAAACAEAASRGLSFASGLGLRHDAPTADVVSRIRDGRFGRPLSVTVRADLGLPWFRPARAGWTAAEFALRNWISEPRFSGGHLVEHQVTAIDKALWVLGDADPVAVEPTSAGDGARIRLADGRFIEATLVRRPGASGRIEERVRCAAGTGDLERPAQAAYGVHHPLRVAMAAFVAAIRSGTRLDHGPWLCRATLAAIGGRTAIETGRPVPWSSLASGSAPGGSAAVVRPLQSERA